MRRSRARQRTGAARGRKKEPEQAVEAPGAGAPELAGTDHVGGQGAPGVPGSRRDPDPDEEEPEGTNPVRFVLLFFGLPLLLLVVLSIVMTPCQ